MANSGESSQVDELAALLDQFRVLFPYTSRKALTQEFTKLASCFDSTKGTRNPLGMLEFRIALSKLKADFQGLFTEEEFIRIFSSFDPDNTQRISLFQFVKGIRVSCKLISMKTFYLCPTDISINFLHFMHWLKENEIKLDLQLEMNR